MMPIVIVLSRRHGIGNGEKGGKGDDGLMTGRLMLSFHPFHLSFVIIVVPWCISILH